MPIWGGLSMNEPSCATCFITRAAPLTGQAHGGPAAVERAGDHRDTCAGWICRKQQLASRSPRSWPAARLVHCVRWCC